MTSELKFLDVFRWSYTPQYINKYSSSNIYHCKARKAIVNTSGKLFDIYWSSDNYKVDHTSSDIVLEFLGNLNDYREIQSYDIWKYDPRDIIDLRHENRRKGQIFLRKDATESVKFMKLKYEQDLDDAIRAVRCGLGSIRDLRRKLKELNT